MGIRDGLFVVLVANLLYSELYILTGIGGKVHPRACKSGVKCEIDVIVITESAINVEVLPFAFGFLF